MIYGTVKLETPLTIEDVNYYNELEERDRAKKIVLKRYDFKMSDGSEPTPEELCPNCGKSVKYGSEDFCQHCGQRLKRCKDDNDTQHKSKTDK